MVEWLDIDDRGDQHVPNLTYKPPSMVDSTQCCNLATKAWKSFMTAVVSSTASKSVFVGKR